jgi:hypothetical protein
MSNKPNPVAFTAAMLMQRALLLPMQDSVSPSHHSAAVYCASLASTLHRLAPACQRQAVAMCNGEWRDGGRDAIYRTWVEGRERREALQAIEDSVEAYGKRLDKRLAKINEALAPLGIKAVRGGDPRGCVLRLVSLNDSHPLPSNGWSAGEWCIA